MNLGFIIDNRKCIGCHACTVACKSEHDMPIGVNRTWVKYIEKGEFPNTRRIFSVMRCNHCEDAPCVDICPTKALFTRANGVVDFDNDRCIGCKSCMQACPYDALYIDPNSGTAAKCNYCSHRLDTGYEPACVNVCPTEAIISGDIDNPDTKIAQLLAREQVTVRKPEKATIPNVFYIEGDQVSLSPHIAPPGVDAHWGSQSAGVGHHTRGKASEKTLGETFHLAQEAQKYGDAISREQAQSGGNAKRVYDSPIKGILWGWEVPVYVLTKAISAGAFLMPFFAGLMGVAVSDTFQWVSVGIALLFLALTGAVLIKDLDRPDRFMYVLLRPNFGSWLVRGAYIISGYGAFLALWAVAKYLSLNQVLPAITWITAIFAALTGVYTAFLFAQAKGRDFWQSPMLSFHMLTHSITAGAAFLLLLAPLCGLLNFSLSEEIQSTLGLVMLVGIGFHCLSLLIEFATPHATEDTQRTAHIILSGRFKSTFRYGVVLLGNVIPFFLLLFGASWVFGFAAAALILFGLWQAIRIMVIAPQLVPLS